MQALVLVSVALAAAAWAAPEAPRYRAPPAPVNEYGAPSNEYGAPEQANEAPYAPSGWRPSGRQFLLPARQSEYYAPPPAEYGPPPSSEEPATDAATEPEPTTTEAASTEQPEEDSNEFADGAGRARAVANAKAGGDREGEGAGVYYVLLPNGRLQRVAYSTDPRVPPPAAARLRNAGFAQLEYMDVEPIRAPVYTYGAPYIRVF